MDFHQDMLARAQERLRNARAELECFTANMSARHPGTDEYLAKLRLAVEHAERAVANAEHPLRGAQALQRAVALGM